MDAPRQSASCITNYRARSRQTRFIPACTGKSSDGSFRVGGQDGSSPRVRGTGGSKRTTRSRRTVHPRVCGEQHARVARRGSVCGSSPRVRGTGGAKAGRLSLPRFIPACAGNSPKSIRRTRGPPVHPRVCGEQMIINANTLDGLGSSPRVRGTDRGGAELGHRRRFIPACAGNRSRSSRARRFRSVHPRVCGEQDSGAKYWPLPYGSSPRVRGTGPDRPRHLSRFRFIPACAGNRH